MIKKYFGRTIKLLLLLILIAMPCSVLGQTPDPLSGAEVKVVGENGYAMTESASDGMFTIDSGLGTGTYTVYIGEKGFISAKLEDVDIEAYEETDLGDITLEPSGVLRGTVTGPEGEPVGGVAVLLESSTGTIIDRVIAGSGGGFQFDTDLETGSYTIRAIPFTFEGFEVREIDVGFTSISIPVLGDRSVYQQGYDSGVKDGVDVTQGEVTDDIVVELGVSGVISGKVTDEQGTPLSGVVVSAFQQSTGQDFKGFFSVTDEDGEYRIANNLSTGSYNVTLLFPDGYVWSFNQAIEVEVEAGQEVEDVDFTLADSGVISGVVVYSNDLPASDASVVAASEDGEYFGFAQTDVDGSFTMDSGLGTGDYNVMAAAEGSFTMPTQVHVEAGKETGDTKLVLQTIGSPEAVVEGTVKDEDGNPLGDVTIEAYGSSTSTNEEGGYNLTVTLPSGEESLEAEVTASARGYEEQTKTKTVEAGSKYTVDFILERVPSGILKGRILAKGAAAEKVTPEVSLTPSDTSAEVGDSITVSGSIDPFEGATEVIIEVTSPTGEEDYTIETEDRDFSHTFEVDSEGTWSVRARVPSGDTYRESESGSVSISVTTPDEENGEENGKQCIIATVTFGSEVAPEVELLRGFRDNMILSTETGTSFYRAFDAFYYSWSTPVAMFIEANAYLKPVVKAAIYPLLGILHATTFISSPFFSIAPEIGSVTAGTIASTLIGAVYITPLLILAYSLLRRREHNLEIGGRVIKSEGILAVTTLTLTLMGYATKTSLLTTLATSAYVLSATALASTTLYREVRSRFL
ncbi:MAG: collagen binding domain-containing protein [Candidatus Bathyarchaeia archaeon]